MTCPMCNQDDYHLEDVDLEKEVRHYGNTIKDALELYKTSLKGLAVKVGDQEFLSQMEGPQFLVSALVFNPHKLSNESKSLSF